MARSTYIYLMATRGGSVLAAFTVKHELVSMGRRLDIEPHDRRPENIMVYRFRDGVAQPPDVLGTLREVLDREP